MTVRTEQIDRILVVTIDRPDVRNAVDAPTAEALDAAFDAFATSPNLDVAVLTGADGTFCAGADLGAVAEGSDRANRLVRGLDGPMGPTRRSPAKPVVAAIEGYAVAGGLELALWCDMRVVGRSAQLGVLCRRWGVPLIDGGTVRLPRIVGQGRALDMILTGRLVGADEAHQWGLVDRVVEDGAARTAAIELAQLIGSFPQDCMRADLASARAAFDAPLDRALLAEHDRGVGTIDDEMITEVERFLQGEGRHGRSG